MQQRRFLGVHRIQRRGHVLQHFDDHFRRLRLITHHPAKIARQEFRRQPRHAIAYAGAQQCDHIGMPRTSVSGRRSSDPKRASAAFSFGAITGSTLSATVRTTSPASVSDAL